MDTVKVKHNPRLLSDNGPSCIASDLAKYLAEQNMEHTRGRPYHPQTQGKIERYHGSLSNLTPVGVCHRRGEAILARRKRINLSTMSMRRKMHARNRVKSLALTS